MVKINLPKIHSRLAELSVVDTLTLPWFLTIFLSAMPFHAATRLASPPGLPSNSEDLPVEPDIFIKSDFSIVDAFFLDGACVIFRIALAILRENEQKIIDCRDEGEIMLLLSGFMESVYSREAPQGTSKIRYYVTHII